MFKLMSEILLLPFRVVQAVIWVASFPLRMLVRLFGITKALGGSGDGAGSGSGGVGKRFGE